MRYIKRKVFFSIAIVITTLFFIGLGSAFQFNGTVRDINGNLLANATINITVRSVTDFSVVRYNFTTTNNSGWFNLTVNENDLWFYEPVITHRNVTGAFNYTDFVGQVLPAFPKFVFDNLGSPAYYLREGGTLNITAINASGSRIGFNYQVKDTKLGYPLALSMNPAGTVTEVNILVPRDRNYSIMIYPNASLPLSFDWTNFSAQSSYSITDTVAGNLSSYNVTTRTLHKQFNATLSLPRVAGFINFTTGEIYGWDEFAIVPFIIEPGSIVHATHGPVPYNLSAFVAGTDFYNRTSGFFNISLPGPAEGVDYLLFATARNGTKYYGGFRNLSLSYGGSAVYMNITLYGLLGVLRNITLDDATDFSILAGKNITTAKQSFTLINKTNTTMTQTSAHIEATVNYTSYGALEFTWMEDISQSADAIFYLPLLNTTGVKEVNIFASGGDYAPKKATYTLTQLITNNNNNGNTTNISINSFNPGAIDSALQASSITMALYISNTTCNIPSPPSSCTVGSTSSMSNFNPMGAIMGGGALSFRMGTGSILVHYVNVDMIASGPPDALFDSSASDRNSGSTFDNAVRFGSAGPTIYDYILVSIPYSETAGSGLDESSTINTSIPLLYDENWNVLWNTTANGTDVGNLLRNFSIYAARAGEWTYLLNGTICHTNETAINVTNPCYIDKTNNRVWIRLPHFSGTGPSVKGGIVAAATAATTSSSGGPGGPKTATDWTSTFTYDSIDFKESAPLTREYATKERTRIKLDNETHFVGVLNITQTTATVNVSSNHPRQVILSIGKTEKFELTQDNYYDLAVTLNSITNNKASITINSIQEEIPQQQPPPIEEVPVEVKESPESQEIEPQQERKISGATWIVIAIIIFVVIGIIFYYFARKSSMKNSDKRL